MKPEEAIIELKTNCRGNVDAINTAIEGLEYRTEKHPYYKVGITGGYWYCPSCDSLVYPWGIRFCAGCGQKMEWSVE